MKNFFFQKTLIVYCISIIFAFSACTSNKEVKQPLSGSNWGVIPNSSAENLDPNTNVLGWSPAGNPAILFYSSEAKDGNRSLFIQSNEPSYGRWSCKVNVKPWSKYKFTGWIKTENLLNPEGEGAGFDLGIMAVAHEGFTGTNDRVEVSSVMALDYQGFTGTNDWVEVSSVFDTGDNDSFDLQCKFNKGGRSLSTGRVWFDNMNLELISADDISTAITVDVAVEKEPMHEYIYGQFIEHMGKCIHGGIWAEMVDDRKFWYAPGDKLSPWTVEGDMEQIQLEKSRSYTGDQTPVMVCIPGHSISLSQNGLGLKKDTKYSGRIVLKSSGSIKGVNISLLDDNDEVIDEMEIDNLNTNYKKYPLSFTSDVFTQNATLQIIPKGSGKVWIGTLSLMPDDNIEGFRADVLELLKGLNSPIYRWPGGNFVSGYDWKDGLGDQDLRPPRKNPAWHGVEYNDVGIHEFMKLCELLDTEPFIAVNAGLGNCEEAREQVEYFNGDANTPMGKWRSENGHPEPWIAKWWAIGNEMYGGWQLGHMNTEDFVVKHNEFVNAMKSVDSDIKIVAVGHLGKWDEMILSKASDNMDMISEHFYRQNYHGGGLMSHVKQIPEAIAEIAEGHRKYRKEIPELEGKDIRVAMDEWNYGYGTVLWPTYGQLGHRYFLRDALGIAAGINEFSKNSDIIFMANFAQTVNVLGCIKANTTHSVYASTGMALKMYREYFGSIPVKISGETRPFDVAATLTEDRKTLVVSVINPTWEEQSFEVNLKNAKEVSGLEVYSLSGPDDLSYNEPGIEESVVISGPEKMEISDSYKVGPYSANLFRFTFND